MTTQAKELNIPGIGLVSADSGMIELEACSDRLHRVGTHGVTGIISTGDRKVEFINYEDRSIAYVNSAMGNIIQSGTQPLCSHYVELFEDILNIIE